MSLRRRFTLIGAVMLTTWIVIVSAICYAKGCW